MVLSLKQDLDGYLWVGLFYSGVDRFDPNSEVFTHYRPDQNDASSLSFSNAWSLYVNREGTVWVGTFDGLNRYDAASDGFTQYKYSPDDPDGLSQDFIMSIYESLDGTLWFGTFGGGLNRFNAESNTFTHFTAQSNGLADNVILGILEDNEGQLWLSTPGGLSRFNPETGLAQNFENDEGLQGREFNRGAYFKSEDGRMYFGGVNGFTTFFPDDILGNPFPPEVVLTGLRLFNEAVLPGEDSPLSHMLSDTEALKLQHIQNDVTIEYVVCIIEIPIGISTNIYWRIMIMHGVR